MRATEHVNKILDTRLAQMERVCAEAVGRKEMHDLMKFLQLLGSIHCSMQLAAAQLDQICPKLRHALPGEADSLSLAAAALVKEIQEHVDKAIKLTGVAHRTSMPRAHSNSSRTPKKSPAAQKGIKHVGVGIKHVSVDVGKVTPGGTPKRAHAPEGLYQGTPKKSHPSSKKALPGRTKDRDPPLSQPIVKCALQTQGQPMRLPQPHGQSPGHALGQPISLHHSNSQSPLFVIIQPLSLPEGPDDTGMEAAARL
eukprot:gene29333-8886_t